MKQSPQKKKIRDYTRKRKNAYGEHDKASRKAIKARKRRMARSYRRTTRVLTQDRTLDPETLGDDMASVSRSGWRKLPDELVMDRLARPAQGRGAKRAR